MKKRQPKIKYLPARARERLTTIIKISKADKKKKITREKKEAVGLREEVTSFIRLTNRCCFCALLMKLEKHVVEGEESSFLTPPLLRCAARF
jgi:hypothetical protein